MFFKVSYINEYFANEMFYIHESASIERLSRRVMVIGWDSSDFTLIKPWMDDGYLPNLTNLMRVSKHGNLTSVYPPVTPMAWSNIVTGRNAGKHGLNGFMHFKRDSYDVEPASAANRRGRDVWELLSDSGKRVAVVGVPLTFPVRKVNGFMISGFLTPSGSEDYCYPKNLRDEIRSKVPGYTPSRPTHLAGEFNITNDETYVKSLFDILEKHIEGMIYIAENKEWDFFMGVFNETDWVQHKFLSTIDMNHPKYDEMRAKKFGTVIRDIHSRLDEALGDLMRIAHDANILVISDHGCGPLYRNVNVNYFLYKARRMRFKRGLRSATRVFVARLGYSPESTFNIIKKFYVPAKVKQREYPRGFQSKSGDAKGNRESSFVRFARAVYKAFFISSSDVDWSRTVAYAPPGGNGAIFMNVKGHFPNGIVNESDYPVLREEIINEMRGLKFNNMSVIEDIFVREQLFTGEYSAQQPDIQLHFAKGYLGAGGFTFDLRRPFIEPQTLDGIHSMNGIFVLKETAYDNPRLVHDVQLVDIVSTILHLMEVPIPSDLDGRSMADKKEKPLMIKDGPPNSPSVNTSFGYTKEEEADIEQRLRSLGYI